MPIADDDLDDDDDDDDPESWALTNNRVVSTNTPPTIFNPLGIALFEVRAEVALSIELLMGLLCIALVDAVVLFLAAVVAVAAEVVGPVNEPMNCCG